LKATDFLLSVYFPFSSPFPSYRLPPHFPPLTKRHSRSSPPPLYAGDSPQLFGFLLTILCSVNSHFSILKPLASDPLPPLCRQNDATSSPFPTQGFNEVNYIVGVFPSRHFLCVFSFHTRFGCQALHVYPAFGCWINATFL